MNIPLRQCVNLINKRETFSSESGVYIRLEHISSWSGHVELNDSATEIESTGTQFRKDDILFGTLNPYLAKVTKAQSEGVCSTEILVLRAKFDVFPQFVRYSLSTPDFIGRVNSAAYGVKMPRASWQNIRVEEIYVPDQDAQREIADFLDKETFRIDLLIEKKEKAYELMSKKRDALILNAVTQGINNCNDTQETGVSWLPKIPSNWIMKKLKFLGSVIIGITYSSDQLTDEGYGISVLRANNIQKGKITSENMVYVDAEVPRNLVLRANDILICSHNGSKNLIGKNGLVTPEFEGVTFGVFNTVLRSGIGDYLYWALQSPMFKHQSRSLLTSTTINQLTASTLKNMIVPVPPRNEQQTIISFLREKESDFAVLSKKVEISVNLLREYRAALITSAVTGQIDVKSYSKSGTVDYHLDKLQKEDQT